MFELDTNVAPMSANEFLKKTNYIDLADLVALKASKLLFGKGINVIAKSPNVRKRIDELFDKTDLYSFLYQNEYNLSYRGYVAVSVRVNLNNEISFIQSLFDTTVPQFISLDNNNNVIGATTWRYVDGFDTKKFRIMEIWKHNEMTATLQSFNLNKGKWENAISQTTISGLSIDEAQRQQLFLGKWNYQEFWDKYKTIPLFVFSNFPQIGNNGLTGREYLNAYRPDAYSARSLQYSLDTTFRQLYKETIINRTRILLDINPAELDQLISQDTDFADFVGDVMVATGMSPSDDNKQKTNILMGNPQFDKYAKSIMWIFDRYMEAAGYSIKDDSEARRTSTGSMFAKSNDVETTRFKKTIREKQLKRFFRIIKGVDTLYGKGDIYDNEDVVIEIKPNIIFDENTKANMIKLGLETGIMSKKVAAQILYDSTDDEKLMEIIKEASTEQKQLESKQGKENEKIQDTNSEE